MYYTLEKAAEVLGVTPGELNRLREAGKVRAFRDGSAWKFRKEDVDNHLTDIIKARSSDPGDSGDLGDSDLLNDSDEELPTMLADSASFESLANTADGYKISAREPEDEDVFLDESTRAAGSALESEDRRAGSSGISLIGDDDDDLQLDSDISILDDSYEPSGSNVDLGEEDIVLGGSNSGSGLNLAGDSGLTLGSVPGPKSGSGSGSGISLLNDDDNPFTLGPDLDMDLAEEDKSTLMAGQETSDSPQDSAVSAAPKNVADDDAEEVFTLESLPEEAETDSDNETYELVADDLTESQPSTTTHELKLDKDEDFQLNPLDKLEQDSDSESSSQVIALDDDSLFQSEDDSTVEKTDEGDSPPFPGGADGSFGDGFGDIGGNDGGFGDAGAGLGLGAEDGFGNDPMAGDTVPISDDGGFTPVGESFPTDGGFGPSTQEGDLPTVKTCPYTEGKGCVTEPDYSGMAIGLGLVPCLIVLILAGIGVYELVRVIWSWDQPLGLTGSVLETIGGLLKLF